MKLKSETYDFLKMLSVCLIPLFASAYVGLAKLLPNTFTHADIVAGIAGIIITVVNGFLKYSSENHFWKENKIVPVEEPVTDEHGE